MHQEVQYVSFISMLRDILLLLQKFKLLLLQNIPAPMANIITMPIKIAVYATTVNIPIQRLDIPNAFNAILASTEILSVFVQIVMKEHTKTLNHRQNVRSARMVPSLIFQKQIVWLVKLAQNRLGFLVSVAVTAHTKTLHRKQIARRVIMVLSLIS